MNADNQQQTETTGQQPTQAKPVAVTTTQLQHPKLPAGSSLIERIVLPAVFSIVTAVVKNPAHAAELQEYMIALRDAINAAYPDAE